MKLQLIIEIPDTADIERTKRSLVTTAYHDRGMTLVMYDGYAADVRLLHVREGKA